MRKILFIIQLAFLLGLPLAAQVAKTINCTPGGLYTSMTRSGILTVTDLTLTGSIDTRDFVIMRDSMVALTSIDLSNASIMAYTGSGGTAGSGTYTANAIPTNCFFYSASVTGKASLKSITFPTTILTIGTNAFRDCTGLTTLIIPSTVTTIGDEAFGGCSGLSVINIPLSVTSIGNYSFADCTGSTSVYIPSSVNSIGSVAFINSSGLINVDTGNSNYSSLDGVLYDQAQTQLIHCPTLKTGSFTIPSSVNTVVHSSFYGCNNLTVVTIPSSVKTIEQSAFYKCTGLTSVSISSSVTSIGTYAFNYCTGLTSIYANSVTPVNLSSSLSVFPNAIKSTCTLYVPIGSKSAYQAAYQWKDFINIVETSTAVPVVNSEAVKLFPNPVIDAFYVSGVEGNASVIISDLNGQAIYTRLIAGSETVSVSTLPRGLYIVKLIFNGEIFMRKMIKE